MAKDNIAESGAAEEMSPLQNVGEFLDEEGLAKALGPMLNEPEPDSPPPQDEDPTAPEEDSPPSEEDGDDLLQEEEVEEGDQEEGDETPSGEQKRINKLTKNWREAEERVKQQEERIRYLESQAQSNKGDQARPKPTPDNPYAFMQTPDEVEGEEQLVEEWLDWCEDNPDGGEREGKDYTDDDVKEIRKACRKAQSKHLPAQRRFVEKLSQYNQLAETIYPFWAKPYSQEHQVAQQFLKQVPGIMNDPSYKIMVGDALYGRAMREQMASEMRNGKSKKQAPKKAPPQPGTPRASVPSTTRREGATSKALNEFYSDNGSEEALARLFSRGVVKME